MSLSLAQDSSGESSWIPSSPSLVLPQCLVSYYTTEYRWTKTELNTCMLSL